MTLPDSASLGVMAAPPNGPKGPLLPDAQGEPSWANMQASYASSASSSPSGKARFGSSSLHSPAAARRLGAAVPYCGAFHSPRDLHPIKYFLTSSDAAEDGHGSVGRQSAHRRQRRRQMKQTSCTAEELTDMADSPGTADEFGRSKSEGKYCERPQRRSSNPILAELQRLERTDSPVLEPFGRSQSEPAGPAPPARTPSPSPSPSPSPACVTPPARRKPNALMQELERLERRDSAHLNAAGHSAEQMALVHPRHQSPGTASPLGRMRPAGGNSPMARPASSHGAASCQAGGSPAPEGLPPRMPHSGAASPLGQGLGLPQAGTGHAGLVTAASLDVEAQRRRCGNPILRELERLERQSSWAGQAWEHQRVLPNAPGHARDTPPAYRNLPSASSEYFASPLAKAGFGSEPRVYPRAPHGPSSRDLWGASSEEPSFESLRIIRHRRGRPILHDLDLSFLQRGGGRQRARRPRARLRSSWEHWRCLRRSSARAGGRGRRTTQGDLGRTRGERRPARGTVSGR